MGSKVIRNVTKILKVTSGRLFGRVASGTGRAEELTPSDVRTLLSVSTTSEVAAAYQPIGSYAALVHTHSIADVTGLQTAIDGKQATLVSGTNIKTVNSTSLLGSGDIVVSASPAGSSGQMQWNSSGAFAGADAVVYATTVTHVTMTAQGATIVPLMVKGAASQSGNLFEARNSAGTLGALITAGLQFADYGSPGAGNACSIFGGGISLFTGGGSVDSQTVFGVSITSSGAWSTAIGSRCNVGIGSVAVGKAVLAGPYSTCIGYHAGTSGTTGGFPSGPGHTGSIILCNEPCLTTANYQWVMQRFTEAFLGRGVTNAAPENVRFQGTGGSGTNIAGSTIRWAPGRSTGDATPASVILQRTVAGSSGSAAQTLADALQVDGNTTAGETPLLLLDIDKGSLQRVSIGAADSGGAGFKVLRVPN